MRKTNNRKSWTRCCDCGAWRTPEFLKSYFENGLQIDICFACAKQDKARTGRTFLKVVTVTA